MDRELGPSDREQSHQPAPSTRLQGCGSGADAQTARDASTEFGRDLRGDESRIRRPVRIGRQVYSINADEVRTMYDIGRFRAVRDEDLAAFRYARNQAPMKQDIQSLAAQGLVQQKTVWTGRHKEVKTFVALTEAGKKLLKRQDRVPTGQAIYTGFVKPAELHHDASIYRVFQREAGRIEKEAGRVQRVVLDYELKKKAYPSLAKAKALAPAEYAKQQAEIAQAHGLKVVNGHIVLPDLRIEYRDGNGIATQVDLEVATKDYHGSHAAEKAAAGFKIYAAPDVAARLSRALDEREITAEILWI